MNLQPEASTVRKPCILVRQNGIGLVVQPGRLHRQDMNPAHTIRENPLIQIGAWATLKQMWMTLRPRLPRTRCIAKAWGCRSVGPSQTLEEFNPGGARAQPTVRYPWTAPGQVRVEAIRGGYDVQSSWC
ncbi:structural protein [Pseudomonas phage PIP]|nr:structural protein [Pseudomonas phage PIP]